MCHASCFLANPHIAPHIMPADGDIYYIVLKGQGTEGIGRRVDIWIIENNEKPSQEMNGIIPPFYLSAN